MKIEQRRWLENKGWESDFTKDEGKKVDLLLVFGGKRLVKNRSQFDYFSENFPNATVIGCSTSGEIMDVEVTDDSLVATAIQFEKARIKKACKVLDRENSAYLAGEELAKDLLEDDLRHVFVLSDGLNINGSELVKGLHKVLPKNVAVTGGLSGDGEDFNETFVFWGKEPKANAIVAVGFYGSGLKVGFGSFGGWDPFGPERLVTKSEGNILYEVDGKSALDLYKKYLGEQAKGLPATGLLYPLALREEEGKRGKVRTVLAINEEQQSMTFAGDLPEGAYVRLMKANFDRLIDGAMGAAKISDEAIGSDSPELAILISCVGRKMVLKQRIEEEVESTREVFGTSTTLTGFYSYGEISPFNPGEPCALHNQTMTITTFSEK